jgi:hypothetical protein
MKAVEEGPAYIQRGARTKRIVKFMRQHRKWVADEDSHRDAEKDAEPGIYPGSLLAYRLAVLSIHVAPRLTWLAANSFFRLSETCFFT